MDHWMACALAQAKAAANAGEVPVGACVVMNDQIIGLGRNRRIELADPLAHAEVEALRDAARSQGTWNLEGATLVVTLEPCAMCTGALMQAHISKIVFGAWDEKAGCCGSLYNLPEDKRFPVNVEVIGGICCDEAAKLLSDFFRERRGLVR